jgi:hypothetical protein
MTQHPIPQDITGYKFHLIGSMTLKQFGELAAGAIIAFIVYKSNLIGVVKWPMFVLIVILAVMIAFVPIEERPLDFWIITFFKNLWKPTKFFWKKTPKIPDFFNYKPGEHQNLNITPDVNYSPARKKRIQEYLKSIPNDDEELDEWDSHYNQKANELVANFDQIKIKVENISVQPDGGTNKPQLKTRIRKLKNLVEIQEQQTQKPKLQTATINNERLTTPSTPVTNEQTVIAKEINGQRTETAQANQLIGVVSDRDDKPVNNALIEVFAANQDQALRISKSNAAGEFYIKTALPNGEYQIKTEAENLNFAPLSIRLTGRLVPNINIIAD